MERLTNKREADAQRKDYENRIKNGYPRNIPEERFLRLAAYEDMRIFQSMYMEQQWKAWRSTQIKCCSKQKKIRMLKTFILMTSPLKN